MEAASLQVTFPISGVAVVTLDHPRVRNALSMALRAELVARFDQFAAEGEVRVVVLTGSGPAFCAGLDLAELSAAAGGSGLLAPRGGPHDPIAAIDRFPGVVIGAINGAAITGGFELALACDLLLASTAARFADTHARVGVMPGWGLSQKLPRRIGGARAKELSLTGNFIDAAQALAWGLVNRVVPPEQLLPQAVALATDMLGVLPQMLTRYKRLIDDGLATTLERGLQLEADGAAEWAAQVGAGDIAARRESVRARGQQQARQGGVSGQTNSQQPGTTQ